MGILPMLLGSPALACYPGPTGWKPVAPPAARLAAGAVGFTLWPYVRPRG
jgi:hypothetical protein